MQLLQVINLSRLVVMQLHILTILFLKVQLQMLIKNQILQLVLHLLQMVQKQNQKVRVPQHQTVMDQLLQWVKIQMQLALLR